MKQLIAHFGRAMYLVGHVTDAELEEIFAKLEKSMNVFVLSDSGNSLTNISHADHIDIREDPEYEPHIDVRV